ncbi:MAG: methyltransferase [Deltaproteobacteria bacterium]|nr:methyltransferase [Deltaproteobacteria bacterium]MBW2051344.1 methyltransferase [Deltaproteobacteria bacterium]MBW2139709.1 methyltransferase [Deltaproteobacteria bacterium]MBW2321952.1 methyltransferase [Deltaproteobacteria bacterium]
MPKTNQTDSDLTSDTIYRGALTLKQPRSGYRFAIDALLLAAFTHVKPDQLVVDLGTGVGVVALTMAQRMGRGRVFAVEIQPRLAECARQNTEANNLQSLVEVLEMDWSKLNRKKIGGQAQLIICNPPYRGLGTGRVSPDQEEAMARHELKGSLETAAWTTERLLAPGGSFSVIYPAARLVSLLTILRKYDLEPKRLRLIHSRPKEKARLALVEARLGGGEELEVHPPLYIYQTGKEYSAEVEAILSGEGSIGPAGQSDSP